MYIHNNFGSFYFFVPLNDMYYIIEHKMSIIKAQKIVRNYFKIK